MATRAGIWIRASTGEQDEANQIPDVERHCQDREYNVTRRYDVHDRSAFQGEQDEALAAMMYDMRTGEIEVLVCWHSDRLERRGAEALFKLLREVKEAGGRIESVQEPQLGETDVGGAATTALSAIMAHAESVKKSERELIAVRRVRDNGALWGIFPWGYRTVGEKYNRTGEPTEDGKRYIPEMFQRVADGESLAQIAAWLRAGPLPGISSKTVLRMIRNRTYMGHRLDTNGQIIMNVPPLVDAGLWKAANDQLSNAPRGRRNPISGKPALLTSVLFCARCGSPMYRKARTAKGVTYAYYRCHGGQPETKGCGNLIDLATTDAAVSLYLSTAQDMWTELRRVHSENYEAKLADIRLALSDLPRQGLSRKDEQAERERLWAREDELIELQKRAGKQSKWKETGICVTCDGGEYTENCKTADHRYLTIGEHFKSLDHDGKRAMILKEVKVYAEAVGDPELSMIGNKSARIPLFQVKSRLFKIPVQWIGDKPAKPA